MEKLYFHNVSLYIPLFMTGFIPNIFANLEYGKGGNIVIDIDFDNINEEIIYEIFGVEGNEADALSDSYLELYELIGKDAMLKLFKHFKGDKVDCPMRLYRPEFIADLAKRAGTDRRSRAKIARAGGYSAKVIEGMLSKRRSETEQ